MSREKIQQHKKKVPKNVENIEANRHMAKPPKFLARSVPLYIFLLFLIIPAGCLGYFIHLRTTQSNVNGQTNSLAGSDQRIKMVRASDQHLVHPLLYVDIENEAVFSSLKSKLDQYIQQKSGEGVLMTASVYFKDLNTGTYFNINPDSLYDPASLMKVPLLMTYLLQAETDPGVLQKKYLYSGSTANSTVQLITDRTLQSGKQYTVEQLLYYMIVYSDNEAFWLLNNHMDHSQLDNLDARLGIPKHFDTVHYPASEKHAVTGVNSIAHYFNVLYNATYLDKKMSAYALNLLTQSNYSEGMTRGVDSQQVTIAHKFGERTLSYMLNNKIENLHSEFHEFGIVYLDSRPYLLGVMTRGTESKKLQQVVSQIAHIVFDDFKGNI